jgi:RHS repeat-associated protein
VDDADTGFVYMQARYYDPLVGRFLTTDPIYGNDGDAFSFNRYAYVNNNPVIHVDLNGMACGGNGDVSASVQKMRDASDGCAGSGTRGPKETAGVGSGIGKMIQKGFADIFGVLGDSEAANEPDPVPENEDEADGMTVGQAIVGFVEAVASEGESIEASSNKFVDLASSARRQHILDGDKTGGGHRPGLGKPGKSEFPKGWSDDKIMHMISDVATDPASVSYVGSNGRTVVEGTREGISIRVIVGSKGDIVTGFPTNVPRNP